MVELHGGDDVGCGERDTHTQIISSINFLTMILQRPQAAGGQLSSCLPGLKHGCTGSSAAPEAEFEA